MRRTLTPIWLWLSIVLGCVWLGAWALALVVSILGAVLSYLKDWPMGATIVCLFGVTVAIVSLTVRMKYVDNGESENSKAPDAAEGDIVKKELRLKRGGA